jgi:hypothetical protein
MDKKGTVKLKPGQSVKGYIPAVEVTGPNMDQQEVKLIHWTEAARVGADKRPNPKVFAEKEDISQNQHVFESLTAGLPAPVRRTPTQRYEALVKRLLKMGRENTVNGTVMWPASLQKILDLQGVKKDGDLLVQVRALAKHFILKSENQQRAKDRKKSVLDWHGHYS